MVFDVTAIRVLDPMFPRKANQLVSHVSDVSITNTPAPCAVGLIAINVLPL
jgi:hypothetical protein